MYQIQELYRNIYRIGVPLEGNPLKEINSYFIRGGDSDLLIDTGFRRDSCRLPLEEGLRALGSDPARRDVYLTHLHADHSGLADRFVGPGRFIYISPPDLRHVQRWVVTPSRIRDRRYLAEGFTEEMLSELDTSSPSSIYVMRDWTLPCIRTVEDGDVLRVGDYTFRVLLMPGHTPGNTMLWEAEHRLMFTGDHILFDITPNITFWNGVADSLGDYLESLRRAREYPVTLALPGHRQTGDYHGRIDALLAHHQVRVEEARQVVCAQPGLRAIDIAGKMRWRIRSRSWEDFPLVQKRFAVGEAIAHLDYLRLRGHISCRTDDTGRRIYGPPGWGDAAL